MSAYPDGWQVLPLAQVASFKAGRTPARHRADYWSDGVQGIPWISIGDLAPFGSVTASKDTITQRAFEDVFGARAIARGTLLMSFKLTIGRVATLGIPACHNEAIIAIYPRPGVDQRYLGYFLSHIDYSEIHDRQIKGNTLNRAKLDLLSIVVPPPEEQRAIADVLDLVRAAIETAQETLRISMQLKDAAMRELFSRGMRGGVQKVVEFGVVPEAWQVAPLSNVSVVQTGAAKGRKLSDRDVVDVPYLRVANVQAGHLDLTEMKTLRIRRSEIERYRLQGGDVVLTEGGDFDKLGRGFIWKGELPLCIHQNHVFAVRTNREVLVPEFLAYLAQSPYGRAYFLKVAHKTTNLACINSTKLKVFPVLLPPTLSEQEEIVSILDAIDRRISIHKRKRAVLEDLFKTLLHKLMTGDIRVSDLNLAAGEAPTPAQVSA